MRYLKESELIPYLNQGKEIQQYMGKFYDGQYKCLRYLTLYKGKDGYAGLLFEVFDETEEGIESIYNFSSIEPDDMYGKEIGPFDSIEKLIQSIKQIAELNDEKYLLAGYLDDIIK